MDGNYGVNQEKNAMRETDISAKVSEIINCIPEGQFVFVEDIKSGVSNWSNEGVEYFGFSGNSVSNTKETIRKMTYPDDRKRLQQEFDAVFSKKKESFFLNFQLRNAKGEYIPCTCKGKIISDEGGNPYIFLGSLTVHKGEEENDAVTDLPKLQKFLSHISRIKKANKECLLMALELNHFNKLNALYGYDLGNRILYEIAKIISEIIGSNGALYRLSGTDFGIVFFGSCLEKIRDIFAQIRDALANFSLDGSAINIEVFGGAIYTKNYKVSYNTVYSYLLSALEKAKDEDNYELVVFDDESHENNYKMLELLDAIKGSIRKDCEGFYLCYQPFVSTVTGKIIGAEALLRWRSPIYGEIPPGRFVPYLESHSCFYDLSIWVLRRAMQDVMEIIKENPGFFVNVNISYKQLERPEFTTEVTSIIRELGFPAKNLQLEITERCRNLDMMYLKKQLAFFREQGIKIALDDYGTGNSTINFLCELPLTSVKIDQTFILNILGNTSNQVVVDSTVQCAKRLGMSVCLEGVETQEIKEYTEKYPANYHQGYFYSRPVEFSKFKSVIHETWPVSGVSLIKRNSQDGFGADSILSMIPGGFLVYADDESQKIVSVNEMLLDIFECENVEEFIELTHGSFAGMVHPEDYSDVRRSIMVQISANDKNTDFVKYRIVTKKGNVKFVRDYGRLVPNDIDVDLFYVFIVEEQMYHY